MDTCQNTYALARSGCDTAIHNSLEALVQMGSTASGRQYISQAFGLCTDLANEEDVASLVGYVEGGLVDMAMLDYPYATDYGVNFPAWPVNTTCDAMFTHPADKKILNLATAIQVGVPLS